MKTIKALTAALLLTTMHQVPMAHATAPLPTLKVCTGDPSLRYFRVGVDIAKNLQGQVHVEPVQTNGSLDNLRKMAAGECDAAIVQGDAYLVYAAQNPMAQLKFVDVGPLYPEYPHLVCNKDAGISSLSDLAKKPDTRIAIGAAGSGAETTWEALTLKKPELKKVATVPLNADLALTGIMNGRDAQCTLVVAGLGSSYMKDVAEIGRGKLNLVAFDEPALGQVKDPAGKQVYRPAPIPGGTYKDLQGSGWFGGSKDTPDVAVDSEFIVSQAWYDANQPSYAVVSKTVLRLGQQLAAHG